MAEERSEQGHRLTWAAAIVAIVVTIPALIIGQVAALIYSYLSFFLFGLSFFPEIVRTIFIAWFGQLLAGGVAGGLAMWLAFLIFKRSNRSAVFYSLATFVVLLAVVSIASGAILSRLFGVGTVGVIASAVGTIGIAYVIARPDR